MNAINFESMYSCRNVLALDAMTALYCRLSVDDANDGDSNSIQNQKKILLNYAQENGYTNYQFFVDDGYSGTTFERPDFKRMIEGIKAGIIKRVIIKDMSRFGRDYLQVGMYTEIMFAEYDIHFIAVNDGVDSQKGENDLTPFRNLFNEWYARDCSKKQRAVKRMKGMAGERISTHAPYGYLKGEDGKLVVDEETAPVVKLIFDLCVQGLGIGKIASELTRRKIPTPGTVEFYRTGSKQHYCPDSECAWASRTVGTLLSHKEYLGHTVNFKTYSKSYKFKKGFLIQKISKWYLRIHMKQSLRKRFGILFRGYGNTGVETKSRTSRDFSLVCSTVQIAVHFYTFQGELPSAENRNDTVAVIIESVPIAAPCTTSERWFWRN